MLSAIPAAKVPVHGPELETALRFLSVIADATKYKAMIEELKRAQEKALESAGGAQVIAQASELLKKAEARMRQVNEDKAKADEVIQKAVTEAQDKQRAATDISNDAIADAQAKAKALLEDAQGIRDEAAKLEAETRHKAKLATDLEQKLAVRDQNLAKREGELAAKFEQLRGMLP